MGENCIWLLLVAAARSSNHAAVRCIRCGQLGHPMCHGDLAQTNDGVENAADSKKKKPVEDVDSKKKSRVQSAARVRAALRGLNGTKYGVRRKSDIMFTALRQPLQSIMPAILIIDSVPPHLPQLPFFVQDQA